jgi:hypothetical protein
MWEPKNLKHMREAEWVADVPAGYNVTNITAPMTDAAIAALNKFDQEDILKRGLIDAHEAAHRPRGGDYGLAQGALASTQGYLDHIKAQRMAKKQILSQEFSAPAELHPYRRSAWTDQQHSDSHEQ